MKLVSFYRNHKTRLGIYHLGQILDLAAAAEHEGIKFPDKMEKFLKKLDVYEGTARKLEEKFKQGKLQKYGYDINEVTLLAPVPKPTSCRDGYAFRQHVASARKNRGAEMIAEFDEYPIFYFTNHNAITGPGPIACMPDHFQKLDFELEIAAVIGKAGRNIRAEEADQYIFGYTIMNDMSARTLQMEEMLLNLGPAKGKDFSTVIGPWLVTKDELEPYHTTPKPGHVGLNYNLEMKAYVNDKLVSEGNTGDMDWTFAEIIERCAYGVDVLPGDVIGSGTVGTGCFLELNGTGLRLNPETYTPVWLQAGDTIALEISGLGRLENTIVAEEDNFSILARKKNLPVIKK
jgi:fumarylacetoacetate (FAA) hydrolase